MSFVTSSDFSSSRRDMVRCLFCQSVSLPTASFACWNLIGLLEAGRTMLQSGLYRFRPVQHPHGWHFFKISASVAKWRHIQWPSAGQDEAIRRKKCSFWHGSQLTAGGERLVMRPSAKEGHKRERAVNDLAAHLLIRKRAHLIPWFGRVFNGHFISIFLPFNLLIGAPFQQLSICTDKELIQQQFELWLANLKCQVHGIKPHDSHSNVPWTGTRWFDQQLSMASDQVRSNSSNSFRRELNSSGYLQHGVIILK